MSKLSSKSALPHNPNIILWPHPLHWALARNLDTILDPWPERYRQMPYPILFACLAIFILSIFLRFNLHFIKFTHFGCVLQRVLLNVYSCTTIITTQLSNRPIIAKSFPVSLSTHALASSNHFSVSTVLPFPEIVCQWNHTLWSLLGLASCTHWVVFEIYPCCCMSQWYLVDSIVRVYPISLLSCGHWGCYWLLWLILLCTFSCKPFSRKVSFA